MHALDHQAFLYGSPERFVAAAAPIVRAGLRRGDAVFAATTGENVAALREELGAGAAGLRLEDTTSWKTRPYERLQAFRAMVDGLAGGQGLIAMGEPVWTGSPAVVRQWARYESIVNLALADAPMRFICLYDSAALPDRILSYAAETHPSRVAADGSGATCDEFIPPAEFVSGSATDPPATAATLPVEGHALRAALAERARAVGIDAIRLDEVLLAASEVASNAVRHGREPVGAMCWVEGDELVVQVRDAGDGIGDPLAGWLPPVPGAGSGWGLPIARQLADAVEISGDGGCAVSLHFSLGGGPL